MASNAHQNSFRTALVVTGAVLLFAAKGDAAAISGGATSVALNSSTVTALVGLGFSVAPIAPGALSGLTATFPITGGDTTTVIDHSGGLAFSKGGATAGIENFVIDLSTSKLTGDLVAGGNTTTGFTFFDIGSGAALTLDPALAGALSSVYGIPNLAGASIGTATISPVLTPEPSAITLAAIGLLAAFATGLRKRRSFAECVSR